VGGEITCRHLLGEILLPPGDQADEMEAVIPGGFVEALDPIKIS
jgi:hypothetical protein